MTAAVTTEKGGEHINNVQDLRFFFHPPAFGLGFHLRSHLILEATHLGDKRSIYTAEGQRFVHTLHHQV